MKGDPMMLLKPDKKTRSCPPPGQCLCRLLFFLVLLPAACSQLPAPDGSAPVWHDVVLPEALSICGEPMPLHETGVREMLDREMTISVWDHAQVFLWLKRSGRYFPELEKTLAERGMPRDLKYLMVAESSLLPYAQSNKGAVGLWQLIEETGMRNGLRRDTLVDERRSFERATDAALRYLQSLRDTFGSWTLAMAAYNCGEARLKKEIDTQQVQDYYRLNLPLETERFIFRIAAIKTILENPGHYGYRLPAEHVYKGPAADTVEITVERQLHLTDFARALGTDFKIIKELNPQFVDYYLATGTYRLQVPAGLGARVPAVIQTLQQDVAGKGDKKQ